MSRARLQLRAAVLAAALAALAAGCAGRRAAAPPRPAAAYDPAAPDDAGPLIAHVPLTLEPGEATEAVGPFYYEQRTADARLTGLPPLWSLFREPELERVDVHVVPPLFAYHRYGEDRNWQFLQLVRSTYQVGVDDRVTDRFLLFPFVWWQDTSDDSADYFAFFPLGGTVKGRLFRDRFDFVLFPLWLQTTRRDVVTDNYLAPIFHVRRGEGLRGWQFWPLAGWEEKAPTTRLALGDDPEVVPGHRKLNLLWPVYWRQDLGLGTVNTQRIRGALPFWWSSTSPGRDHHAALWPFFSWTDDRDEQYRQWNLPFPFVARARGAGKTLDRVWPLFSVGEKPGLRAETYLWPVYRHRRIETEDVTVERTSVLIALHRGLDETNRATGQGLRVRQGWPFYSWRRDPDGRERLQVLALFEPLRDGRGVQRNWSPLWSLYRREENPAADAASDSLLWNLWRRDRHAGVTNGSLLFGLVQYQSAPGAARRWRLLWLGPGLRPAPGDPQ
jgi:hypothetical protein